MSGTGNGKHDFIDPKILARPSSQGPHSQQPMLGSVSGKHRSPIRGSSLEFAQYRKYVPGHDLRLPDGSIRATLIDGSVLIFEPMAAKDGVLSGNSTIYGRMIIRTDSVRSLSLGALETETYKSLFAEWLIHAAIGLEFAEPETQ